MKRTQPLITNYLPMRPIWQKYRNSSVQMVCSLFGSMISAELCRISKWWCQLQDLDWRCNFIGEKAYRHGHLWSCRWFLLETWNGRFLYLGYHYQIYQLVFENDPETQIQVQPINRFISPTVCEYNIETNCGIFYEKKNRIAYGTLCDSLCLCPRP